jgi:hypothetical protein
VVVEPVRGFFSRSMRRAGAGFFLPCTASVMDPLQMGPVLCAEGCGWIFNLRAPGWPVQRGGFEAGHDWHGEIYPRVVGPISEFAGDVEVTWRAPWALQ